MGIMGIFMMRSMPVMMEPDMPPEVFMEDDFMFEEDIEFIEVME